jgi:hypothetical protein
MLKMMWIQRRIERLVASFMISLSSIYRRYHVIYSGLALNCTGRFQSIRAKTCFQGRKEPPPPVVGALVGLLLTRPEARLLHARWVPVLEGVRVQVTTLSRP